MWCRANRCSGRGAGDGVRRTLALLEREAGGDPVKFRANVETWFNDSMERVSGWYRRRTQLLLLFWAAAITVATNADTLVIAKALWRDPALRQSLVARAERYAAEQQPPDTAPVVVVNDGAPPPPPLPPDQQADVDFAEASAQYDAALADLAELQLPIGWEAPSTTADPGIRLYRHRRGRLARRHLGAGRSDALDAGARSAPDRLAPDDAGGVARSAVLVRHAESVIPLRAGRAPRETPKAARRPDRGIPMRSSRGGRRPAI